MGTEDKDFNGVPETEMTDNIMEENENENSLSDNLDSGEIESADTDTQENEDSDNNHLSDLLSELSADDSSYLEQTDIKVKKPFNKKILVVIISAVVVALGVLIGLYIWNNPSRGGKEGNTNANLANNGISVSQGDKTYYVNIDIPEDALKDPSQIKAEDVKYSINRISKTEDIKLCDVGGISLNVNKDYLYFIGIQDNNIYKVKTSGSTPVKMSTKTASSLVVKGQYIYFTVADQATNEYSLYSMRLDGSNQQKLSPANLQVARFVLADDGIFYVSAQDGFIYKTDFKFSKSTKIIDKQLTSMFQISGNNLYYSTMKEGATVDQTTGAPTATVLYKTDLNGKNQSVVSENISQYNVSGDYIYYTDAEYKINRMKLDGTGKETFKSKGLAINIAGDLIYYVSEDGLIYKMNLNGTDPRKV